MPEQHNKYTLTFSSRAPNTWWMRLSRVLWSVLLYIWGTLVVGIVIGTIANLSTTKDVSQPTELVIIHLVLTFPFPTFSILGLLLLLTLLSWIGSHKLDANIPVPFSEQNRTHMLRRLRLQYQQMHSQSLQGAVQVELGLASRPAAVQNVVSLSLHLSNQPEQLLPPHTSIIEAYQRAQQELLILGEPGAGKSTLLLELALYLTEQAELDATQPLPILLPLSSWAVSRRPLPDWLSEQLAIFYDIPRSLAQLMVQDERILPLLDGLDEIEASSRAACIASINIYHRDHLSPLVVCSRTSEYLAAAPYQSLVLHTAVVVQPLSLKQVDEYLNNIGKATEALRTALQKNVVLRELAINPLMLHILIQTYLGTSVQEVSQKETQLQAQIWADYVQSMISRKWNARQYTPQRTIVWLSWLALQMRIHNLTIFSLKQVQPNWLTERQQSIYQWSIGLIFGLIFGLVFGLIFGLSKGSLVGLLIGLLVGLLAGLLGIFFFRTRTVQAVEPFQSVILRVLLWRFGYIPWDYRHFLDNATESMLLIRVGNGYSFIHRLLQDYFATLNKSPSDSSTVDGSQARIQMIDGSTMITGREGMIILQIVNETLLPMKKIEIELLPSAEYTLITNKATIASLAPNSSSKLSFRIRMDITKQVTANYRVNGEMKIPPLYINAVRDNPYSYGNPVDERAFFGRQEELENILQAVTKPIKQDIFVVGERRAGKTSLLYRLEKRLNTPFIPVYIILTECEPRTDVLLEFIVEKIIHKLIEFDILGVTWTTYPFASTDFIGKISEIIQSAEKKVPNIHLILLFDEADFLLQVEEEKNSTKVDERIQRILRAALQSSKTGSYLRAVVAGSADLSTYMLQHSSPFFNHFRFVHLKPLSKEETHDLIVKPAHLLGYAYPPNAIERITSLSGGQPYYCQALCYEAFNFALQQGIGIIDDTAVDVAEEKIRNDLFGAYLSGFWQRASSAERRVLTTLARGKDSTAFSHTQTERLLDWQLIQQTDGGFCFSAELFHQWTIMALERG